ncbi:ankyrin repeat-containing domain protein, partial [Flagelloscypha sp. PMI_526]
MEALAVLLQKSPDVNLVWKSKGAPLHVASLLVRYGANVNLPFGPEAKRPLFLACSLDQPKLDLVTFLLVSGADIHMGSTRNTPLNAACISGSLPLVKLLFTHGANQSRGRPPLHIASELNNLPLLQLLVDKGADPNVTYAAKTALSIACSATVPNILIIRYLLEEGATVQPRTDIHTIVFERALKEKDVELTGLFIRGGAWNDDHLRRACAAGDVLTAKFILERGSQASVPGLKNLVTSLLVNAVRKDEFDLVQLLVQHGADVNVFNNEKRNSAHYAFHNTDSSGGGNTKLARYLLEQGARLSPLSTAHISVFKQAFQNDDLIFSMLILERTEDKQALFAAAREANNLAMAKFVVGKCVSLDTQFSTKVLCQIASSSALADAGHLPFIRLLLAHGATPDADNILAKAGANDNIELVELLLSSNANINQQYNGNTPLYAASIANHSRIVRILLSKGAQLDAGRSRPLGAMCSSGNVEIATMLLDAGAVVDTEDFASACTHGHLDILHLLFDAHPDLCSKFNFHLACQYRHFEVVKFLFDNGKADLEASYRDIGTALHAACLGGMFDIVRLLVEKGSDVCADVGVYGTSLQAACASDSQAETLTIVHFLLEHGAEVDPSTGQHGRPLKIASEKNNEVSYLSADNYAKLSLLVSSLRTAVSYGQTHLVKWFLDVKHFDPASPHPTDGTLLHLACSMGQLETAKLLIERQPLSCINTMHPTLGTPLMCASRSTNSSLVQYLLSECRADLHKWSPTYETASKNVEILVKRGADAGGVEKIAKEKGFRDVLDALANAKAWKVRNPDANGY